jgi:hypothetical protein
VALEECLNAPSIEYVEAVMVERKSSSGRGLLIN